MTVPALAFTEPTGPDGAPLLVLGPSLGTSHILWENAVPALRARFRTTAWDLPGHGASPAPTEPFTVGELADAVAGAAPALAGGAPVYYAGVSLGGATGLELLRRHPGLVERAAIIASGAQLGSPEAWNERAAQARAQSTSSLIIGSASRWFAPDSMRDEPALTGRLLHALQDADDEGYALCCEALAAYDVRARLGEIRTPVLVLWGRFDAVAPEEKAHEIAEGVADGRAVVVEGAGHLPPAERPEAVASALLDFFTT